MSHMQLTGSGRVAHDFVWIPRAQSTVPLAPRATPAPVRLPKPYSMPSNSLSAPSSPGTSAPRPASPRLSGAPLQQVPAAPPSSLSHHENEYSPQVEALYEEALAYARSNQLAAAREAFNQLTSTHPEACRVWVSWAQMEKRTQGESRFARCREILHRGLVFNMQSACLVQAWGLLELQRGNLIAAVMLLERAVRLEPARCSPVLKWQQVQVARRAVQHRWVQRRRPTVCSGSNSSTNSGPGSSSNNGGGVIREQQQQMRSTSRAVDGMAAACDPHPEPSSLGGPNRLGGSGFESDDERSGGYDWTPMGSMG